MLPKDRLRYQIDWRLGESEHNGGKEIKPHWYQKFYFNESFGSWILGVELFYEWKDVGGCGRGPFKVQYQRLSGETEESYEERQSG